MPLPEYIVQDLSDLLDKAYEDGWNEGYRRGLEDQEEFGSD